MRAVARANTNIAFVKYWGKRDPALNLPAAGSLSLTLEGLSSTTEVVFGEGSRDELLIGEHPADQAALRKALRVVDAVRARAGIDAPARIRSVNNFPTGAGLASSASGLAALALASASAAGLHLEPHELSALARRGSGSACRSIFGGYVEWQPGVESDGHDSHGVPLFAGEHWDLRCCVAVVSSARKPVTSTRGMLQTAERSPYQAAFLAGVPADLEAARRAVAGRDLRALRQVAERSCLRMHAAMMASDPPLLYLQPRSWEVIGLVTRLREEGLPVFFTADAGPNVKVFCEPSALAALQSALASLSLEQVLVAGPGGPAELLEGERA